MPGYEAGQANIESVPTSSIQKRYYTCRSLDDEETPESDRIDTHLLNDLMQVWEGPKRVTNKRKPQYARGIPANFNLEQKCMESEAHPQALNY